MPTINRQHVLRPKGIQKVLIIAFCWILFHSAIFINDYYFTLDLIRLKKLRGVYEFWPDFLGNLILAALAGLIGGYFLVFKLTPRYNQKSFAYGVISSGLLFIFFYIIVAVCSLFLMGFVYFLFQMDIHSAFIKALNNLMVNLNTPSFFVTMVLWGLLVSATQFMLQVNDKFGQGVLWKFITGKYSRPREEERIFMFLDLKGSTSIAEKMESKRYFEWLKEIYFDITSPIIESLGEIYQYVGDEVVISWSVNQGVKENNCIACFFRIVEMFEEKKSFYKEKYGTIPTFKAGLHLGKATVGEIGVIKKDIVYSGDVLNTTSRIQAMCNTYKVKILISSTLTELLEFGGQYINIPIGEIDLQGKEHKVGLGTVQKL